MVRNLEAIAIVAAVVLYYKESPDRKDQRHYEAWQVIDKAARVETSYARYSITVVDKVSCFQFCLENSNVGV